MKYALRQLAKSPGFTTTALATLALGIGVNTAAFMALNRMALQTLPFPHADRLVKIAAFNQQGPIPQTADDFVEECDSTSLFDDVASETPGRIATLVEPGAPPVGCITIWVSGEFYTLFGSQVQLGRLPTDAEDRHSDRLAVVSNLFWREHYGASPGILGRTVRLDNQDYTVVGVMTQEFDDPTLFDGRPAFFAFNGIRANAGRKIGDWFEVAGRLKPGISLIQAQADLDRLAARLAHDSPKSNTGKRFVAIPYPKNELGEVAITQTWLVMALSGVVLLIACVNLANLQLVRITGRNHEIAVRLALGCSRMRLVGLFLSEIAFISTGGGVLGLLMAKWTAGYVARYFGVDMPIELRVIAFAFSAAFLTGIVFGAIPVLLFSRTDVNETLKRDLRVSTSDRSRRWLRQALVVAELALALTLLSGAGFFVGGIYKITHEELGWHADNVVVGSISLDHEHYGEGGDSRSLALGESILSTLRGLPGVEAAALGFNSPATLLRPIEFLVEGRPRPTNGAEHAGWAQVSTGFLSVYGIRLISGRDFDDRDRPGAPLVVIINESMARKYWPGEDPIGKGLTMNPDHGNGNRVEVVGVMADFKGALQFLRPSDDRSQFISPWFQYSNRFVGFNVRTVDDPRPYEETIRRTLATLAPGAAPTLSTVQEVRDNGMSRFIFLRRLLLQTAVLGLVLAGIGIYGVVAQATSERTKEIGIRMALGGRPQDILWLFIRNGIVLACAGAFLGLFGAFTLVATLGRMMPNLPGNNPWITTGAAMILITVAIIACWLPARRTTKVDPIQALRVD